LPKPASPTEIISRVERLLSKKPSAQTRVISFVNTSNLPAMTMVLVNIAAALGEQNKRVTLADIGGAKKGHNGHDKDTPKVPERVILETHLLPGDAAEESGFEVLPSGLKVLHYDEFNPSDMEVSPQIIHHIRQICANTDYVLLDLPLTAAPATSSIIKYSDLAVIVSDYRLAKVLEIRNTLNLFRCLGLKPEDTSAVLVDPEGDFPGLSVCNIRPYMETNLGISLGEVISFDAKMSQLTYLDSRAIVQSNPGHKFSQAVTQIAKYVSGYDFNKKAALPHVDNVMPALERKY